MTSTADSLGLLRETRKRIGSAVTETRGSTAARDRASSIDQGVPLHGHEPVDLIELQPPGFDELRQLVAEWICRLLTAQPQAGVLSGHFPFAEAFLDALAQKNDMGLRNKLLLLRNE